MISRDRTFCAASLDGRCGNRQCFRWLTKSLVAAFERDGDKPSMADLWDGCSMRMTAEQKP